VQVKHFLSTGLDHIFPPRCFGCRERIAQHGHLCAVCWEKMEFLPASHCDVCGRPFGRHMHMVLQCGACLEKPPPYARLRFVCQYNGFARTLITRFKYGDDLSYYPILARWMAHYGAAVIQEAEVIIPVPLHRLRLWKRRYNQAVLFARQVHRIQGIPLFTTVLKRPHHTISQTKLTRSKRKLNVRSAFVVDKRKKRQIIGRHVLLIDDVVTTGATVEACTKVLLKAGAAKVSVLAFARVWV